MRKTGLQDIFVVSIMYKCCT